MTNNFFWVLEDNNGKRIKQDDPLEVIPHEYFDNPNLVTMFNFFVDVEGKDRYSVAVDLRNGMFYIGDWNGFNISVDPEPEMTKLSPTLNYRLIYGIME